MSGHGVADKVDGGIDGRVAGEQEVSCRMAKSGVDV
jgi:hypothetical protein